MSKTKAIKVYFGVITGFDNGPLDYPTAEFCGYTYVADDVNDPDNRIFCNDFVMPRRPFSGRILLVPLPLGSAIMVMETPAFHENDRPRRTLILLDQETYPVVECVEPERRELSLPMFQTLRPGFSKK